MAQLLIPSRPPGLGRAAPPARPVTEEPWPQSTGASIDIALLVRYYERVADRTVLIGRRITFGATGTPYFVVVCVQLIRLRRDTRGTTPTTTDSAPSQVCLCQAASRRARRNYPIGIYIAPTAMHTINDVLRRRRIQKCRLCDHAISRGCYIHGNNLPYGLSMESTLCRYLAGPHYFYCSPS